MNLMPMEFPIHTKNIHRDSRFLYQISNRKQLRKLSQYIYDYLFDLFDCGMRSRLSDR